LDNPNSKANMVSPVLLAVPLRWSVARADSAAAWPQGLLDYLRKLKKAPQREIKMLILG
jgi:hypothetical protein